MHREIVSHRTMRLVEGEKQLTTNSWGGRRHTQCPDLSLQNKLYKTLHTLTRNNGSTIDVDASNFFDNIPHNLIFLSYCKAVLPVGVMKTLSKALLQCRYTPITNHGKSSRNNRNTPRTQFCRPDQG